MTAACHSEQCRVAKAGTPACFDKQSLDGALQPAAFEPIELMMVGPTWRQGPVRSQALEGRVHGTPAVSPGFSVVHGHESGGCRLGLGRYSPCQWPLTSPLCCQRATSSTA